MKRFTDILGLFWSLREQSAADLIVREATEFPLFKIKYSD